MQNLLYRPVVLSYFSQRGDKEKDHLSSLENEYKSIAKAWEQSEIHSDSNQYFNVFFPPRGSAEGDDVAEDIRHFKKRIVLFHFSGHAGSQQLFFRDKDANAAGLAGLLGEAPNLKMVVLNGCATHDQVKLLFENKVKIVIATQGKINDSIAGGFAVTFFAALSSTDYTIRGAFAHALNKLKQDHSQLNTQSAEPIIWRGLDTGSDDDRNRWELYIRDEECEKDLDDPNWWKIEEVPTLYSKPAPAKLLSPKGVNDPNVFIGREEELETIFERLDKKGQLLLINSEGGIGKTTLAARYWNESLYEYKYNAWLFCENGILNALKELAPNLNLELTGLDEAQQLTALRHALSQVHDDFLLVLDNANDADDIRWFRKEFAGFHWRVLITSRSHGAVDPQQELSIKHLPPPLAKELFVKYYYEDSPDFNALLDKLLNAINYHTLLVELFAKNLNEASELGLSLADFLQKLETGGLYLGEDSFDIQTPYTGYVRKTAANTDEILDILYDFTTLSEEQRYLLVSLALLPAENYDMKFLIELLVPTDKKTFYVTVKSLYHKGWLSASDRTYRLSPVVQGLVLEKNKESLPTDAEALLENLKKKLENDGYNFIHLSLHEAARWARLAGTITQHLQYAPCSALASLNFYAGLYFENTGDLVQAKQSFEKYGEISTAINDIENVAISYQRLGGIYSVSGDLKNALNNYQENFRIMKEISQSSPDNLSYKNNLAVSYAVLGGIYQARAAFKKALENYQQYNHIEKELSNRSPENLFYKNELATSYEKLGNIYKERGDFIETLENYQQFFKISREIYQSNPENLEYKNGLAIAYEKLGSIYEAKKDWENALENYQKRTRLSLEIHQSSTENLEYKKNLAISYAKQGGIYKSIRNWKAAQEHYHKQLSIFKELTKSSPENLSFKNGVAFSYYQLATIFKWQNELSLSLEYLEKCYKLFRELWETTDGQILEYTSNFAEATISITQSYKELIQSGKYENSTINEKTKDVKAMRREAYTALLPFAEADKLNKEQIELFKALADESWYEF